MVAGVAHELNTPIGNALTSASTLQERLQDITRSAADGQLRTCLFAEWETDLRGPMRAGAGAGAGGSPGNSNSCGSCGNA